MAEEQIEDMEKLSQFHEDGYLYSPDHSSETTLVFLQQPDAVRCS